MLCRNGGLPFCAQSAGARVLLLRTPCLPCNIASIDLLTIMVQARHALRRHRHFHLLRLRPQLRNKSGERHRQMGLLVAERRRPVHVMLGQGPRLLPQLGKKSRERHRQTGLPVAERIRQAHVMLGQVFRFMFPKRPPSRYFAAGIPRPSLAQNSRYTSIPWRLPALR